MLTYEQALDQVLATVQPLGSQELPLTEALGAALAEDIEGRWDLPMTDNSAMDGYAFAWAGQQSGDVLAVVGRVRAGDRPGTLAGPGKAVRILTGAPLPAGCDSVVPQEDVVVEDGTIRLRKPIAQGANVRRRGDEFRQGEPLLPSGTTLRAGEIGLLAANGTARVKVHRRPRVALLTTGDELVNLGTQPGPGQIVNSNQYLLGARLREEGCDVVTLGSAEDSREGLLAMLRRGLDADLLLTTGGVSVGDYDLVQETLKELGFKLGFWKVAIKPGKPVLFGTVDGTPVFGLPGNPAAAATAFQLFVRPALCRLRGFKNPLATSWQAVLTEPVQWSGNRQAFFWGRVSGDEGRYRFTPSPTQGSGYNRCLQTANALLPVAPNTPALAAGTPVEVMLIYLPETEAAVRA